MKISKYVHSCILVQEGDTKLLFDPGKFSFTEGKTTPTDFHGISIILITHSHPDHMDAEAIQTIMEQNKSAIILGSSEVAKKLCEHGLTVKVIEEGIYELGGLSLEAMKAKHEDILSDSLPQNIAYRVNKSLINPGDSFSGLLHAWQGSEALLLPVLAPWLKETEAYAFALSLQPKVVIPVHDGFAKDFFLEQRYASYKKFFKRKGIDFKVPAHNEPVAI